MPYCDKNAKQFTWCKLPKRGSATIRQAKKLVDGSYQAAVSRQDSITTLGLDTDGEGEDIGGGVTMGEAVNSAVRRYAPIE